MHGAFQCNSKICLFNNGHSASWNINGPLFSTSLCKYIQISCFYKCATYITLLIHLLYIIMYKYNTHEQNNDREMYTLLCQYNMVAKVITWRYDYSEELVIQCRKGRRVTSTQQYVWMMPWLSQYVLVQEWHTRIIPLHSTR